MAQPDISMSTPAAGIDQQKTKQPAGWTQESRVWRPRTFIILGLVLAVGAVFAWPFAKRAFKQWNQGRRIAAAQAAFDARDYERAILTARAILESDFEHVEAARLIARALEISGTPGALSWRMRIRALRPEDRENALALAKDALRAGDPTLAAETIAGLGAGAESEAVFHEVSARLAEICSNEASALKHWEEAARLAPGDDDYTISLATARLGAKDAAVRDAATAKLKELASKPGTEAKALRVLFSEAKKYAIPARVRDAADALVAAPGATFTDRLLRLEILRQFGTPDSTTYLDELRKLAEPDPDKLYELLVWMNRNDLATLASEWIAGMSSERTSALPVCIGVAQTYAKAGHWEKLRDMTERGGLWGEMDYLRRAFLSRALERLGEEGPSATEWKQSLAAAQGRGDAAQRLERLAVAAGSWRWTQKEEEVLWRIARTGRAPRWVLDTLWSRARSRSHTVQLHEAAGYIAKAAPGDVTARNYYNFLCLLLRTQEGNPHHEAAKIHAEHPENHFLAVTHALSLYQQDKLEEALKMTSALPPEELRTEGAIFPFYHGVFLIASDRVAEGEEFVKLTKKRIMLPEEQAILDREREAARKRADGTSRERQRVDAKALEAALR